MTHLNNRQLRKRSTSLLMCLILAAGCHSTAVNSDSGSLPSRYTIGTPPFYRSFERNWGGSMYDETIPPTPPEAPGELPQPGYTPPEPPESSDIPPSPTSSLKSRLKRLPQAWKVPSNKSPAADVHQTADDSENRSWASRFGRRLTSTFGAGRSENSDGEASDNGSMGPATEVERSSSRQFFTPPATEMGVRPQLLP